MTALDIKTLVNNILDDYSFPNQPDDVLNLRMDKGICKFIDKFYAIYEQSEIGRQALSLLKRDVNPTPGLTFNLNPAYKELRYITYFVGWFKNPCSGIFTRRNIKPLSDDKKATTLDDSFAKPDNYDPRYELTGNGVTRIINILADNAPNKLNMIYIKDHEKIDLINNQNMLMEIPDSFIDEVADQIIKLIMGIEEDPRYPVQEFEMKNN